MYSVPAKAWWQSKLFWFGVLQVVVGILELIATEVLLSDGGGWAAVVSGVVTIVLRYVTKQPITFSGKPEKTVAR